MNEAPLSAEVYALCHGVQQVADHVRPLLLEQLLSILARDYPDTAGVVASVLIGQEAAEGRRLGELLKKAIVPVEPRQAAHVDRLPIDVLVLTVKEEEFRACLSAFGIRVGTPPRDLAGQAEIWTTDHAGLSYGIAVIGTDGNVESAIELGRLWTLVDFKAAVLVGMAAGVREEVRLGDVVVSSVVFAYEFQRMTEEGPAFRPKPYAPASRELQRLPTMSQVDPEWRARVCREVLRAEEFQGIDPNEVEKLTEDWRPKVRQGAILAGSKLIEDGSLPDLKEAIHDRILAAEMEGAGFAAVCVNERIPWVVVRGVADYGEPQRRKSWQFPATYAAAALVRDAIASGRLPLIRSPRG